MKSSYFLIGTIVFGLILVGCQTDGIEGASSAQIESTDTVVEKKKYQIPENLEEAQLTNLQYHVVIEGGTEKPFDNEYWDHDAEGIYVDIVTGEPLFSSTNKYDSGTGWPSFDRPIDENFIVEKEDNSLGMERTEVQSSGGSHLGHVFDDGPQETTGERFCINSASLRFVAKEDLEGEGYGQYLKLFEE